MAQTIFLMNIEILTHTVNQAQTGFLWKKETNTVHGTKILFERRDPQCLLC